MVEDEATMEEPMAVREGQATPKRERSTIQFPYNDLNDAVEVVQAIHEHGGGRCGLDQLAAWMGHDSVTSGTFRMKVNAARVFGLVETERGQVSPTRLGRDLIHPERQGQARVQAFLSVPLYKAIFDRHRGYLLPPDVGLERLMVELGVSEKQANKARQTFRRSAEQAGFFSEGRDRLVLPAGLPTKEIPPKEEHEPSDREEEKRKKSGNGGLPPDLHPFILGLLQTLPEPGSRWPQSQQQQWLDTAKGIFGLIYEGGEAE
jgi:hypothetical protein